MQERRPAISQLRLAHIQELQAEAMRLDQEVSKAGTLIADVQRELRTERVSLRKDILKGALVEPGPLQAFIRKIGRGSKRRVIVIVK